MISGEVAAEVEELVGLSLRERFAGDLIFDPIVVQPAIDHYGDEYLDIFVVYKGGYEKLDLQWTLRFPIFLQSKLSELGVRCNPLVSYVEKSEWEEVFHSKHPRADEPW